MTFFPGFDIYKNILNDTQYNSYFATHLILLLLYVALLAFHLVNTWRIVYKQGRWRTLPILGFYILAFFAITARIFTTYYSVYADLMVEYPWVFNTYYW